MKPSLEEVRAWLNSFETFFPDWERGHACAKVALTALNVADMASNWAFGDGTISAITGAACAYQAALADVEVKP
jgi:hypothetical protein